MTIKVKEKDVVVPGQVLAEGLDYLPSFGTFREGNFICSKVLGLAKINKSALKVVPLAGRYAPQEGDYVIGVIEEVSFSSWIADINSPYEAMLPMSLATEDFVDTKKDDLTKFFNVGDVIFTKIERVTKSKNIHINMRDKRARKLRGGIIVEITPTKVPRLIGKKGSMIEMIKQYTDCNIIVGQNGWVWLKGTSEDLAAEAVALVENESHIEGLTDRIKSMLEKATGKKLDIKVEEYDDHEDQSNSDNGNMENKE